METKSKTVIISAYTCCPDKGSEPGNGWNWIVSYLLNHYSVIVYTSGKYRNEITKYESIYLRKDIHFHFVDTPLSLTLLKIPVFGIFIHYFLWLWRTSIHIKKPPVFENVSHGHHVTYSSIKFGTPLYNFAYPVMLGPLGGASTPHNSLKRYFGKAWIYECIKENISELLAFINPSVGKSIERSNYLLVSNSKVLGRLDKYKYKAKIEYMYDAGLSDYFKIPFQCRSVDDEIIVLWTGRILARKGLNLAIDSFKEIVKNKKNINKFRFIVVGAGPLLNECKDLVRSYAIEDCVDFIGQVDHKSLIDLYKKAHIFLFPSLKDSCPMQVFEAMATGLPVVTLNHQGMSEQVIYGSGIKISVGNGVDYPKELADAVYEIVSDSDTYLQYSMNSYSHGQNQIWSKRIKKFLEKI